MRKIRLLWERIKCAFLGHPWGLSPDGYRCIKCEKVMEVEE